MQIQYELQDPIELVGKQSGKAMRSIESITLRSPTARVFADLERRGLLADGHETEMALEMVIRCGNLDTTTADRITLADVQGAMEAMTAAGFFPGAATPPKESEEAKA